MAQNLYHHFQQNPCLPYISNVSPTETRPHYVAGSNILTSIKEQLEKRPGHTAFENTPTTFAHPVVRLFQWRLWGGDFFVMANVVGGGQSIVYKLRIGTDASFVSIFTSASAVAFDFVTGNNVVYFGNGTDMKKYDGSTVTNWGIAKPAAAPTATSAGAGSISAFAGGFSYKYAFGNSNTGHIGQISDPSAYTGNFSTLNYTITGSNTSDGQVNQVHIYRTGDGGATWYELPNSPISYVSSWSLTDSAINTALNTANQASLPGQNAPPPPGARCQFFAGRIWVTSGETQAYSVFEEIINGVAQESFPTINRYTYGQEITGQGVAQQALMIHCRSNVFTIIGDSLATFIRKPFKSRSGVDNQANVATGGQNFVGWFDTTSTSWVADGITAQETGAAIRTDLAAYTQTSSSCAFHSDGIRRWFLIADFASSKTSVFDADLGQWMPGSWSIGGSAMASCEVSPGVYKLLRTNNAGTKVLQMAPATYTDDSSTYSESLTAGLQELGQGKGSGEIAAVEYVAIDRNGVALSDIGIVTDDDPTQASFTSVFANEITPTDRTQGTFIITKYYPLRGSGTQSTAQRGSVKFTWNAQSSQWILYNWDLVSVQAEQDVYTGGIL